MSTSGHRRREGKLKTLEIPGEDATHVGDAPGAWEAETTTTGGMPTGWDAESTISGPAPAGWELPPEHEEEVAVPEKDERTLEQPSSQSGAHAAPPGRPHPPRVDVSGESTVIGPPADFQLSGKKRRSTRPPPNERPVVEVEVRRVSNVAARQRQKPTVYEIWTKNRVYALDAQLHCVDVIDLGTGQSDQRHPFIGGQVVGGQRKIKDNQELTFPLPTPDSEAVFQTITPNGKTRLMVTSKVTRVLMLVQVVKVSRNQSESTWTTIASTRDP